MYVHSDNVEKTTNFRLTLVWQNCVNDLHWKTVAMRKWLELKFKTATSRSTLGYQSVPTRQSLTSALFNDTSIM